jgi:peptidyl-prolyl cis-trans isomerase D
MRAGRLETRAMTLMWMKKQAPWVIFTFGILILVGLLWMDRAGSYRADRHHNIVGKVDGQEIPTERFQTELKNYLRGEEQRTGKAPDGIQLVQIREGLFNYKVQSILMDKLFKQYQLHASKEEMMDYVMNHPQEVAQHIARYKNYESMPPFLADSNINQAAYQAWLSQDSVYDRYSMREMEEQLRSGIIPQFQLQTLVRSQVHRTALEEGFTAGMRENKARVKFYQVSADSFAVSPDKFKEADLKAYFEANPDSFYFREDAARLNYVRIPLKPSKNDTSMMFDFAKVLKERVQNGEKFADLAADYSNDPASADKGGKLEGARTRQQLEPAVAEAAFALKPGEISDPVLGRAGYYVVLLNDRKKEAKDTVEKVEISQILLRISSGTETVDSLMTMAEEIRANAQKQGLEKAGQAASMPILKTPIFDKSNMTPLGSAYVSGINSFAFSPFEAKEKISEALQADDGIYLFERDAKFSKGRNFERSKERIAADLAKKEKLDLAQKELEAQKPAILAAGDVLPARLGKAVLDSTSAGAIAADNWLPGFGYSSPALFKVFAQPVNAWGPVLSTETGAVLAKVTEKNFLAQDALLAKGEAQISQNEPYVFTGLYQEWLAGLPKTVKVENKMDLVFRN